MMNFLIRILSKFTRPIDGNPDEWLERPYTLMGEVWREFVCGSCRGIYKVEDGEFQILAVQNTKKNDHFDRVLDWFEKSCRRDGANLAFLEVENPRLREKLGRLGFIGGKGKMVKIYSGAN